MIKRYDIEYGEADLDEKGRFVDTDNCIVAEQENMMMGDDLDELNKQIQKQSKNGGPYDVMIILKEVGK